LLSKRAGGNPPVWEALPARHFSRRQDGRSTSIDGTRFQYRDSADYCEERAGRVDRLQPSKDDEGQRLEEFKRWQAEKNQA